MSKFLPSQLHSFGKKFFDEKENLGFDLESEQFNQWKTHHRITDYELEFIKQGWNGEPLQATQLETIIPFGKFKGRKLVDVPTSYLEWSLTKEWIKEWGTLQLQIEDVLRERKSAEATKEDIKTLLKPIE